MCKSANEEFPLNKKMFFPSVRHFRNTHIFCTPKRMFQTFVSSRRFFSSLWIQNTANDKNVSFHYRITAAAPFEPACFLFQHFFLVLLLFCLATAQSVHAMAIFFSFALHKPNNYFRITNPPAQAHEKFSFFFLSFRCNVLLLSVFPVSLFLCRTFLMFSPYADCHFTYSYKI